MTKKLRHRRARDQRRRRWGATGTGVGIAVGGVMAAALVSMGTASADNEAAPDTDGLSELVQAIDGFAFTSTGAPNDILGTIASQIDSDLASTVFGPEIDTIADQILAGGNVSAPLTADEDGFEDLVRAFVDPTAFTGVCNATDSICAPTDPAIWFEQLAYQLDSDLAPTVFGPEIDTIADQIIAAFTTAVF